MDLQRFLSSIHDVDTALSFYHVAGAAIDQGKLLTLWNYGLFLCFYDVSWLRAPDSSSGV